MCIWMSYNRVAAKQEQNVSRLYFAFIAQFIGSRPLFTMQTVRIGASWGVAPITAVDNGYPHRAQIDVRNCMFAIICTQLHCKKWHTCGCLTYVLPGPRYPYIVNINRWGNWGKLYKDIPSSASHAWYCFCAFVGLLRPCLTSDKRMC